MYSFESPLILGIIQAPATSFTIFICVCIWLYILQKNLGYEDVAMSYEKIVKEKQYWRGLSASLSHINLLHIFFNMSSLWSCRIMEIQFGVIFYLKYSLLMVVSSVCVIITIYHIMIYYVHKEHYRHSLGLGYSCVVFGWMTILSQLQRSQYFNFLGFQVPMSLAPWSSLIVTSLIIPNASFIGHLSGIIAGYIISFMEMYQINWYNDYSFYFLAIAVTVVSIYSFGIDKFKFVQVIQQRQSQAIIQNGVLIRHPTNNTNIV